MARHKRDSGFAGRALEPAGDGEIMMRLRTVLLSWRRWQGRS